MLGVDNSADAADPRRQGDRTSPLQALSKLFHLRRHVGKAAYPIGRVAAFENKAFRTKNVVRFPHCRNDDAYLFSFLASCWP